MDSFITYAELPAHGIRYSRVHLARLMAADEFPPAVQLSANRIGWSLAAIERFKEARPIARSVQRGRSRKRRHRVRL